MSLIDLIFPVSCLNCKKGSTYFCDTCLEKVTILNQFNAFTQTFSIFNYEGVIRKGIVKLKYNFAFDITNQLADICVQKLNLKSSLFKDKNILLTPIPLHPKRSNWRGFNQSALIGKKISDSLNWQYQNNLLIRKKAGKNQVGLRKFERVRNICGKFAVNPEARVYQNITYIVFDDVATTGSTIKEAIKVLKGEGAIKVFGLVIAS